MAFLPLLHVILIIFILFLQGLQINASSCSTYLVPETQTTFDCPSHPHLYTFNDLEIPSPYKKLAISATIQPTNFCSTNTEVSLLMVYITPPGSTVRKRILMMSYSQMIYKILLYTEDTVAPQLLSNTPMASLFNKPYSFYMGLDLTTGSTYIRWSFIAGSTLYTPVSYPTLTYGSTWAFDSSTVISVCSDVDGNYAANCIVQNLKVSYSMPAQFVAMLFSNIPLILADYKFDKNLQTSSPGTLASASFSTLSSPTLTPNSGIEFNFNPNQYINIPGFIPRGQDLTTTTSLAFSFYIKIDQAPPSEGKILSYYCQSLTSEIFSLSLTTLMKLKMVMKTSTTTLHETISLGQWNSIYLGFVFTAGGYGMSLTYINGLMANLIGVITTAPSPSAFSTSDEIKIGGGFKGYLRRLQIYSPAAFGLKTTNLCASSDCSVEMGFSNPPTCLKAVCDSNSGSYSSLETCEPCPTGCSVCTNPGACQSCSERYYLASGECIECPKGTYVASPPTSCLACPMHCSSCSDAQTCESCNSGYGLYNDLCMICPTGTYLSDNKVCKKFSPTLQDTLTNSQLLNSGATQAASAISDGSAISLSAAVSGRIFSQIKYLNISYSVELQVALLTWLPSFISLGLTPDIPGSMIQKIPNRHVPYVFEKYDVPSSFLRNFWENLGIIIFIAVLWFLSRGIEYFISPTKKPRLTSVFRKVRTMIQNFLITALYGVYGDLVMFSIIEYRSLQFGWNISLLSLILSVVLLLVMFFNFWYQVKLLLTYQKLKKQDEENPQNNSLKQFTKNHEGSQAYWKDFKDYSISPQLFLVFLSGRDLLFSLILATMFKHPLAQTILIVILNCLMMVYLLIKRPFESSFDAAQQIFFEIIGLIVNISVFVNAVLDTGEYLALQARTNIGKLIIIANMIFNLVTACFMLFFVAQMLVDFYKRYREKKTKKIEKLKPQTRIQKLSSHNPQANQNLMNSSQNLMNESGIINNSSEIISSRQEKNDINLLPSQNQQQYYQYSRIHPINTSPERKNTQNPVQNDQLRIETNAQVEHHNNISGAHRRKIKRVIRPKIASTNFKAEFNHQQ